MPFNSAKNFDTKCKDAISFDVILLFLIFYLAMTHYFCSTFCRLIGPSHLIMLWRYVFFECWLFLAPIYPPKIIMLLIKWSLLVFANVYLLLISGYCRGMHTYWLIRGYHQFSMTTFMSGATQFVSRSWSWYVIELLVLLCCCINFVRPKRALYINQLINI